MDRLTALEVSRYENFGGNFFDSVSHAELFRSDEPYNFGVTTSRLFSSMDSIGLTNKRWMYLTMANGNYEVLPTGTNEYRWGVIGDAEIELRIIKQYVSDGAQVGKDGISFLVGVDKPWYSEPALMKCEDDNAPLIEIIGHPQSDGMDGWVLECKIQDGNPNSYIDSTWFEANRTLIVKGSKLSNEENDKYRSIGPWSTPTRLQSVVGQVGAEIEFTDRFIRMEMAAAKKGGMNSTTYKDVTGQQYRDAFSRGVIYYGDIQTPGKNNETRKGFFIPEAEKRLLETVEDDVNWMCEYGRLQIDSDRDTSRIRKVSPGWRQYVRDGHYFPHNGYFSLQWLVDKLQQILTKRRRFMNRKPLLVGGTGAITFISQLLADYVPLNTINEPGFGVSKNPNPTGVHELEYQYGFQFTRFKAPMGVDIQIMYDPSKDDSRIYKTKAPGSYLPLESFQIDILEFGQTEDAMENTKGTNITMVKEADVDYYFSIANAMDLQGAVKDGSNVYAFNKNVKIAREMSGSLCVWDTYTIGRIEWILS